MAACGVTGATDITGFGLLGHALEMAQASGAGLRIDAAKVPILDEAREMASMGLVPLGSHANRAFCGHRVRVTGQADEIMMDLLSDAQTSGGMLMGLDPDQVDTALAMLAQRGVKGAVIGRVGQEDPGTITVMF